MKYIEKVAEKELWNAGKVELYDFSRANQNEESRIEAVATVASICYGKPPKDAKKLVERLRTESGRKMSSAFEFIRSGVEPKMTHSLRNLPTLPLDEEERIGVPMTKIQDRHREEIATFRLTIPIFIARQVMRHRQFGYQELSRRYTTDKRAPLEFWKPADAVTEAIYHLVYQEAEMAYKQLVYTLNRRPEIARAVLPQSLYTTLWMQGDVPAWKNYFKLRIDKHTQKEHQELAQAMLGLLERYQPELWREVKP